MDRNALATKRRQEAAQLTTRPHHRRIARDKNPQQERLRPPSSGKIREAKDSSEFIRVPRKADVADRPSAEEDRNVRNFHVSNVGRNGTLYLKASRMVPAYFTQPPVTPPGTSDGPEAVHPNGLDGSQYAASGTFTPRATVSRSMALRPPVPMPPPSMANGHQRRRTRSHSFSTIDGFVRPPTTDSVDFQILLNGRDTVQRPKSSVDLSDGLLDFRIPHYKLGTPRFSERGTAYLHNSMYTSSDVRSSVLSRAEYDKLFPAPPGGENSTHFLSQSSPGPYLHPSSATYSLTPSRTPPTPSSPNVTSGITLALYDNVETNIDNPTLVRYSPATGRITAATPARLIAQITSPLFLDYELLADFFLTFRNFLSCSELLEYLLTRMRWALANDSDAGRIVRVRTFVALRHWILNYFADDFLLDPPFRQWFCNLVNELARALRQRLDRGGTDLNIIGELKKCWRRTCAMFWPVADALDTSADADIFPGEGQMSDKFGASATSLPLSVSRHGSRMAFTRSSQIQLPADIKETGLGKHSVAFDTGTSIQRRTASIPTSPMSVESLTVLSCSVPFLRQVMSTKVKTALTRPLPPQRNPPQPEKQNRPNHGHKRSGSFSDALRDRRPPLPSAKPESVDIHSLQSVTFTGGLVRGLLLQPSPSKIDLLVPLSPELETQEFEFSTIESASFQERARMKKLVGDVRRALSSRKPRRDSPSSSNRSTNSSESYNSARMAHIERPRQPTAWQQLRGPPRIDLLAEQIETSYREAFQRIEESAVFDPAAKELAVQNEEHGAEPIEHLNPVKSPGYNRLDSHVTTGSRSIVIAYDTGIPDLPVTHAALPSVSSWSSGMVPQALSRIAKETSPSVDMNHGQPRSTSPTPGASDTQHPVSLDPPVPDFLAVPESWQTEAMDGDANARYTQARKSSNVHPSAIDLEPFRHQLRRRPGGDLKAAENVHDLVPAPRAYTGDSYSTFTYSLATSGEPSHDLSGTHFSGHQYNGLELPTPFTNGGKKDSFTLLPTHSSQPNMRSSFEKQVTHLKGLPDRPSNGGIKDTLAKLEGKASSPTGTESTAAEHGPASELLPLSKQESRSGPLRVANASVAAVKSVSGESQPLSPRTDRQGASIYHGYESDSQSDQWVAGAQDDKVPDLPQTMDSGDLPLQGKGSPDLSVKAVAFVDRLNGIEHSTDPEGETRPDSAPKSGTPQGSFLLDDNESLSDISTEIADQSGDESLGVRSFFFDDTADDDAMPMAPFRAPPTPPSTVGAPGRLSLERVAASHLAVPENNRPLKEAASAPKLMPSNKPAFDYQQQHRELRRVRTSPSRGLIAHLPFVLAFESDVIAGQLTIVEKDALDEVDWKDLVGLNWQQTPRPVRNWVEFLSKDNSNGIDMVITRFNLVVKWVVSECILIEAPLERVRCITKFIHIAAQCHRLRNYASMY